MAEINPREARIAEETVSAIDFTSRMLGAIEDGNWYYARDKMRQLQNTLANLARQLDRNDQPAAGPGVAAYVTRNSQSYRIGRALYGQAESGVVSQVSPLGSAEDVNQPITPEIAAHVLFHLGVDGGYPASGFKSALMGAIAQADIVNRELLALGFPGYVVAFNLAQMTEYGTRKLQEIAAEQGEAVRDA
ncbi:hypothetical protein JOL79_11665 [Microbispora sp. RL4-1S]|uniref:Uncharacterized protein n=1 Tax=Microbispora oryzae TaxID=2806554 RepID=A0A941AJ14_9ACTN|nr:hypothetical protein [Microbispora oryzae]MBP2704472.1 hypothetical protein [Microbispora oryzae]